MVHFALFHASPTLIQKRLDQWSEEHPYISMDEVEFAYEVDRMNGEWNAVLCWEEN